MPLDYFALSYLLRGPRKKLVEDGIQIINPVTLHSLCVRNEKQENRGGRGGGWLDKLGQRSNDVESRSRTLELISTWERQSELHWIRVSRNEREWHSQREPEWARESQNEPERSWLRLTSTLLTAHHAWQWEGDWLTTNSQWTQIRLKTELFLQACVNCSGVWENVRKHHNNFKICGCFVAKR